jgi:hypothetical protein
VASIIVLIIALVFAGVGVMLLIAARKTRQKLAAAAAVVTSSAGSVSSMHPGEAVEVAGTLRCESPLTSELAQESCAYFHSEITREYEVQQRSANNSGPTRWEKRYETLSSNSQRVAFLVEDQTGSVRVDPTGAEMDGLQVVNRLEQELAQGTTLGGLAVSIGQVLGGQRTVGYRHTERILRNGDPVYVLGVVGEDRGIGNAQSEMKDKQFVISHRSEEELTRHWRSSAKWEQIWSWVCFAIAAVVVVIAVMIR